MNYYLTPKQEEKIYREVSDLFESKYSEITNCESNYIFDGRNYFDIHTDDDIFTVEFKTKQGKLLKRSINIVKL